MKTKLQPQTELDSYGSLGPNMTGPNFMALLIASTESTLTETGNSVLTASVFHGLNFGFCACVLHVTRHSTLTRLAQKFGACT